MAAVQDRIFELFNAFGCEKEIHGKNWMILGGVLSFIAGGFVFFAPWTSLVMLSYIVGIWLVVYGPIVTVMAFPVWRSRTAHPTETFVPAAPTGST